MQTDNTELRSGLLSPYCCVPAGSTDHLHLVPSYDIYSQRNCIFASARMVLERKFNCTIFRFHKTCNLNFPFILSFANIYGFLSHQHEM